MYMRTYINVLGKWHKLESSDTYIEGFPLDDWLAENDLNKHPRDFIQVLHKNNHYELHKSHFTFIGE